MSIVLLLLLYINNLIGDMIQEVVVCPREGA